MNNRLILLAGLCTATAVHGQVTLEPIATGYTGWDISADGNAVAGKANSSGREIFRWTRALGIELLGRDPQPLGLGTGGTVGISYDGTKISASIADATLSVRTIGQWTEGVGWTDCIPPLLLESKEIDGSYGTAYGISGDGASVVGMYWRETAVTGGGSGHGFVWHETNGSYSPNPPGDTSTQLYCADEDASVVAGRWRTPGLGYNPVAWRDGVKHILFSEYGDPEIRACSPDGDVLVGRHGTGNINFPTPVATRYMWNGDSYDHEDLGNLPGTTFVGTCRAYDVDASGNIVVGANYFNTQPGSIDGTGFIWTPRTGMFDVQQYMIENGVVIDPTVDILDLKGISADGSTLLGTYWDTVTVDYVTFLLHIPVACSDADITTTGAPLGTTMYGMPDGQITGADINYYVNAWIVGDLITGDMTTTGAGIGDPGYGLPDGFVTGADIQYYVNLWIAGCP